MQFAGKKGYWTLFVIGGALLLFTSWRYLDSFATVSFKYDEVQGSIQLSHPDGIKIQPQSEQPLRLKKGEYTLTRHGENIARSSELLTVDGSWKQKDISFSFTRAHLASLYEKEQAAIETALLQRYPKIQTLYTINGGALYNQGDYYGAALVFKDQTAPHRDRLHVLMYKRDGIWQVLSTPPTPVLSKQDFPTIDTAILRQINQVK